MIEQRKYQSAAAMCHRVYESCLRLFGPDHWATLEAQMNSVNVETESNELKHSGRDMVAFPKVPSAISYPETWPNSWGAGLTMDPETLIWKQCVVFNL